MRQNEGKNYSGKFLFTNALNQISEQIQLKPRNTTQTRRNYQYRNKAEKNSELGKLAFLLRSQMKFP